MAVIGHHIRSYSVKKFSSAEENGVLLGVRLPKMSQAAAHGLGHFGQSYTKYYPENVKKNVF